MGSLKIGNSWALYFSFIKANQKFFIKKVKSQPRPFYGLFLRKWLFLYIILSDSIKTSPIASDTLQLDYFTLNHCISNKVQTLSLITYLFSVKFIFSVAELFWSFYDFLNFIFATFWPTRFTLTELWNTAKICILENVFGWAMTFSRHQFYFDRFFIDVQKLENNKVKFCSKTLSESTSYFFVFLLNFIFYPTIKIKI